MGKKDLIPVLDLRVHLGFEIHSRLKNYVPELFWFEVYLFLTNNGISVMKTIFSFDI